MSDVNTGVDTTTTTQSASSTDQTPVVGVDNSSDADSVEKALEEAFSEGLNDEEVRTDQEQGEDEKVVEEGDSEPEAEADEDDESKEAETDDFAKAEARKETLNQEIRDLVAERNRYKAEVAKYQVEALEPLPTVDELADYLMSQDSELTEAEARIEARMRLHEVQAQRQNQVESIAETRQEIDLATMKAMRDFPELFDAEHKDFDKDLASGIMQMYEDVAGVQRGADGEVLRATVKLAPFLHSIGLIHKAGVEAGKRLAEHSATTSKRQKIRQAVNPYPSRSFGKGEETEQDFVDSCLDFE